MRVPHVDFGSVTKVSGVGSPYQTAKGATPEAFGASVGAAMQGVGQQISKAGDVANKIALDIQQEDNESEAEKLDAEAMRRVRIESYGGQLDPNSPMKAGYYNLRNDDAVAQTGAFQAAIKKHYDDVLGMASNDAVKRMLSKSFTKGYQSEFDSAAKFHIGQRNNAQKIHSAARIQEAQQQGVLGDDKKYKGAYAIVAAMTAKSLRQQGITDRATIASAIQDETSKMAIGRIQRLMSDDDYEAARVFAEREIAAGRLDELSAGKTLTALRNGVTQQKAFKAADAITGANGSKLLDADGMVNPDKINAAYEKAKTLPADVRKAAVTQIDRVKTRLKELENMAVGDAQAKALKAITDGEDFATWLHANPKEARLLFSRRGAVTTLQNLQKKTVKGQLYADTPTDAGNEVMALPSQYLKDGVISGNILQIGSNTYASTDFTEAQWKRLPGLIRTAKNKESSDASKSTPYTRANTLLKEIAPKLIARGAKEGSGDKDINRYQREKTAVDEWITSQYEASGKTKWPTDPEIRKYIRTRYIGAYVEDGYGRGADDIETTRGLLNRYATLEEDQKDAVEVDWEQFQEINPGIADGINEEVNNASLGQTFTAKGRAYVKEYGLERLKAHISALTIVGDVERGRSYFQLKPAKTKP